MEPAAATVSKSRGRSQKVISRASSPFPMVKDSSQRRILAEEPPGMTALNFRPSLGPPQRSWRSSPKVSLPTSISKVAGVLDVPGDTEDAGAGVARGTPSLAYSSPPMLTMCFTMWHSDSTLLTMVGHM